jgi:23S rRNA pseudouridine2605 synthase
VVENVRIHKYLADCGVASRRGSEELIRAGKIKVNNRPAEIGQLINPRRDTVVVNGKKVIFRKNQIYIMLHKPRGYVTTLSDELGRKCVKDLLSGVDGRVFPVGRLDRESEGLLLLTNDGALSNAVTHPAAHISKVYRVTVPAEVSDEQVKRLSAGIDLGDGKPPALAQTRVLERTPDRTVLQMTLFEGRNRQIRLMLSGLGLETARLKRLSIGAVKLGMLPPGKWRELMPREVESLKKAAEVAQ